MGRAMGRGRAGAPALLPARALFEGQVRRMQQTSDANTGKVAPLHPASSPNGQGSSFAGAESTAAQSSAP